MSTANIFTYLNSDMSFLNRYFFSYLTAEDIARLRMTCHAARVHPKLANAQDLKPRVRIISGSFAMMLLKSGTLFVMGLNGYGELGLGEIKEQKTLIKHPFFIDKRIDNLQMDGFRTLVLAEGKLYVMGTNTTGELGLDSIQHQTIPIEHPFFINKRIDSLHIGKLRTLICADGKLFVMGCNHNGQLGLDAIKRLPTPQEHPFFQGKSIESIHMGWNHTLIRADGKLYVMGCNKLGQLGFGSIDAILTPQEHPFFSGKHIESIHLGAHHTLIRADGKLFVMGSNFDGQIGLGDIMEQRTTPIEHPFFKGMSINNIWMHEFNITIIQANGKLFIMGRTESGQLGLGKIEYQRTPKEHPFFRGMSIESIHIERSHTLILAEGKLFVMGDNKCGQLGLSNNESQPTPKAHPFFKNRRIENIQASPINTFIRTDEQLYVMGRKYNEYNAEFNLSCGKKPSTPMILDGIRLQRPAITTLLLPNQNAKPPTVLPLTSQESLNDVTDNTMLDTDINHHEQSKCTIF